MWISIVCAAISSLCATLAYTSGTRELLHARGVRAEPKAYAAWITLGVVLIASTFGALPLFGGSERVFVSMTKLALVLWLPGLIASSLTVKQPTTTGT